MAYNGIGRDGILCVLHDVRHVPGELPFLFNRRNRHNLTYLNCCSIIIEIEIEKKIEHYPFFQSQKLMFGQLAIRVGLIGLDKLRKLSFPLI